MQANLRKGRLDLGFCLRQGFPALPHGFGQLPPGKPRGLQGIELRLHAAHETLIAAHVNGARPSAEAKPKPRVTGLLPRSVIALDVALTA
jgi:hypothetical protein